MSRSPRKQVAPPDVSRSKPLRGVPWWGAGALFVLGAVVLVWGHFGDHGTGQQSPDQSKRVVSGEEKVHPWTATLKQLAEEGHIRGQAPTWSPEPWQPRAPDDMVIDRFVLLKRKGDPKALDLLAGKALAEWETVEEAAFPRRATDTYLRSAIEIKEVSRGEPDGRGGQLNSPGLYTLHCKGMVKTPPVRVRDASGQEAASNEFITNPELVVEVSAGKILGVKATNAR